MIKYSKKYLSNSLLMLFITTPMSLATQAELLSTTSANSSQQTQLSVSQQQSESTKANALFEQIFQENLATSPISQTYLGIKTDYGRWDERSEQADLDTLARNKKHLALLTQLDQSKLDEQTHLSYELLYQRLENSIADFKWRYHTYPVNQMHGGHSFVASFLINQHQISDKSDALAYISRLEGVPHYLQQLEDSLAIRAQKGIIAPKFVFPYVISDSENIITGAPFSTAKGESVQDSALLADFKRKVDALTLDDSEKTALISQATKALAQQVAPAYSKFIAYIKTLELQADERDGVWKLPQGEAFYKNALARTTTTEMSSAQIHELGLSEVARIHKEMQAIMEKVNFSGDLQAFFTFMREDKQFYYPATTAGKERYLNEATALIDTMESRLDEVFNIKPKASLIVKQVEPFREQSAGKAFYNQASPDGSRPGTYYANLYNMDTMPSYQMEALAYHEGIPGHHMQFAIAQELQGIPKFRRFGSYTAYIEGWGLYSEYFPKEMGFYSDPYSDFGRLAMELWRSCRLVVDTGIHSKQWTREQGIQYYVDNTPNVKADAVKMVERHIVMPSQATAYKIGMIKILELREDAKQQLGDKFDIREFHTLLLKNGPLPLDQLSIQVQNWIASK